MPKTQLSFLYSTSLLVEIEFVLYHTLPNTMGKFLGLESNLVLRLVFQHVAGVSVREPWNM